MDLGEKFTHLGRFDSDGPRLAVTEAFCQLFDDEKFRLLVICCVRSWKHFNRWKLIYRDFDPSCFIVSPFIGFRSSLSFAFYAPLIFSSSFPFFFLLFFDVYKWFKFATTQESSICRFNESDTTSLLLFTNF